MDPRSEPARAVDRPTPSRPSIGRRLLLLVACVAAGLAVGQAGQALTGDPAWFLALPVIVALAWLFVADPRDCQACDRGRETFR